MITLIRLLKISFLHFFSFNAYGKTLLSPSRLTEQDIDHIKGTLWSFHGVNSFIVAVVTAHLKFSLRGLWEVCQGS